jgi:hypothetical protein
MPDKTKTLADQIEALKESILSILPTCGMPEQRLLMLMQSCYLSDIVATAALESLKEEEAISVENGIVLPRR